MRKKQSTAFNEILKAAGAKGSGARRITGPSLALAALLAAAPLAAQQRVPFNAAGSAPVAPQGLPLPPLPEQPVDYATAEGQDIRVQVLVTGLRRPWSLAFVGDDTLLVTERTGALRAVRGGKLDPNPVEGAPSAKIEGLSGLMDIALHPSFATNGYVYLSYNKPLEGDEAAIAVARGRWDGTALRDTRDVFVAGPESGGVSRLAFGSDGMLYVSMSGGGDDNADLPPPQNPASHAGKVLRLTPDGAVPRDNPFVGRAGYRPEIFTLGHRSTLGLAVHPATGVLWQVEMGPNGGDELNRLEAGGNYGWPLVSLGRTYPGPWQSQHFQREGFVDPVLFWVPSISTSGLAFYTGDALPKWKGDIFVGGMRYGEIPNTGKLERILLNEDMEELRREPLLVDLRQRIRDVRQGPDGFLYLLTDYDEGALLRIEPAR
jgi:glucose/arabinose dehydrogenase